MLTNSAGPESLAHNSIGLFSHVTQAAISNNEHTATVAPTVIYELGIYFLYADIWGFTCRLVLRLFDPFDAVRFSQRLGITEGETALVSAVAETNLTSVSRYF